MRKPASTASLHWMLTSVDRTIRRSAARAETTSLGSNVHTLLNVYIFPVFSGTASEPLPLVAVYIVPRTGVFTTYTRLNTGLRLQRGHPATVPSSPVYVAQHCFCCKSAHGPARRFVSERTKHENAIPNTSITCRVVRCRAPCSLTRASRVGPGASDLPACTQKLVQWPVNGAVHMWMSTGLWQQPALSQRLRWRLRHSEALPRRGSLRVQPSTVPLLR